MLLIIEYSSNAHHVAREGIPLFHQVYEKKVFDVINAMKS